LSQQHRQHAVGLLLWARRVGDVDRLLQQQGAAAGSGTLSAYVVAEHKLVIVVVSVVSRQRAR